MRLLHGLPRRSPGVRLPGRGRAGRGPRGAHRRGAGRRRHPRPRPAVLCGRRRGAVRVLHAGPGRRRARPAEPRPRPERRGDPRSAGRQPVPLHRLRKDPRRGARGGEGRCRVRTLISGGAVATVSGEEYANGHVVVENDRIAEVGEGVYTGEFDERVDASGCLVTPGLINTHHHLYQWATRGMAADHTLFEWLVALYPVWGRLDAEITHAAGTAGMARL